MALPVWPHAEPPFHPGEQAVQRRAGAVERMSEIGPRVIRAVMPDQHREFFPLLPFVVLGAVDDTGQPWASVLTGAGPGFVSSPDEATLEIVAWPPDGDPLAPLLHPGAALALLGIELPTRRRNRANGRVGAAWNGGFRLAVQQSFGNCPKYIQRRVQMPGTAAAPRARTTSSGVVGATSSGITPSPPGTTVSPTGGVRLSRLEADARALVRNADTFFIATNAVDELLSGGADVSHRGGRPGFVHVGDEGQTLAWPDFSGNRFFNTLGNIAIEPRAGLLFADFERGDLLHVAGRAEIVWDEEQLRAFPGAERLVRMRVSEALWRPGAWPLRWTLVEASPSLEGTGVYRR